MINYLIQIKYTYLGYLRGNQNTYDLIHSIGGFAISTVTYMELVQGMRNKDKLRALREP